MPHSETDLGALLSEYSRKIYMAKQVSHEAEAAMIQECTVRALGWYPMELDLDYLQELPAPLRSMMVGSIATMLAGELELERQASKAAPTPSPDTNSCSE